MKKILVVEDEKDILELLVSMLQGLDNHRVMSAVNGEEALKLARSARPDVILLDVQLPGMDGYAVCRALKRDPLTCAAKVVMISGLVQSSDREMARQAGADGYLTKPFNVKVLLGKIKELTGR